ncbi:MAG: hypothetical protein ACK5KT_10725 [Dysgonomonas sp.]
MKRWIKIIILFILVAIILFGGWNMYKGLEYNKETFSADIYSYISPQTTQVFNINKNYNIDNLSIYDSSLSPIIQFIKNTTTCPAVICYSKEKEKTLIIKASKEQEIKFKKHIRNYISPIFPPQIKTYKNGRIEIYNISGNNFISCTFYKGIFAMSKSYKQIEYIIDTDPENTFFRDEKYSKEISDIRDNSPISFFLRHEEDILAFDFKTKNDTINLNGSILLNKDKDSTSIYFKTIPYLIPLPQNICIDYFEIQHKENLPTVKIILNKMY